MKRSIPILLYHSVDKTCSPSYAKWNVPPAAFARHMKLLELEDYQPIQMSSLMRLHDAGKEAPARSVVITFDDGLRDFLTALEIMSRHGFPSTLFTVSGFLGTTARWLRPLGEDSRLMLSAEELRMISESNVEIGAHTHTHPQLDLLPGSQVREELVRSKQLLEDIVSRPVTAFAYPHGYSNYRTRMLVREAGFAYACRVRNAMSAPCEDRAALSRINILPDLTDRAFLDLVRGVGLDVAPSVETLSTRGWRLVRRMKQLAGSVETLQ